MKYTIICFLFLLGLNSITAQFLEEKKELQTFKTPKIPDGSPIGSFQCYNNSN
ncbi:MAG: hypothetical protein ACI93N_001625 [Flavobacteriaceae bacterium]|jgi:hypothetical protein